MVLLTISNVCKCDNLLAARGKMGFMKQVKCLIHQLQSISMALENAEQSKAIIRFKKQVKCLIHQLQSISMALENAKLNKAITRHH